MCAGLLGLLTCLMPLLSGAGDEAKANAPSPGELYERLRTEFREQAAKVRSRHTTPAPSKAAREKLAEELDGLSRTYARRMLEVVDKHPRDPVALRALDWIVAKAPLGSAELHEAMVRIARDYVRSDLLGPLCENLGTMRESEEAVAVLRSILEKNPRPEIRGQACFELAQLLLMRADGPQVRKPDEDGNELISARGSEKMRKEAEKYFAEVVRTYATVKVGDGTLGPAAETALYEIRNLAIGKIAPDIDGVDSHGIRFKLSDYRGKVVVLDFWGRR
jgi:hypothetical protein